MKNKNCIRIALSSTVLIMAWTFTNLDEYGKCADLVYVAHGDLSGCDVDSIGYSYSIPTDISADGIRVSGESPADDPSAPNDCSGTIHDVQASGWTCPSGPSFYPGRPNGLIGLGYLPSSVQNSIAYGIAPDGMVTVGYSDAAANTNHPVIFLSSGIVELPLSPDMYKGAARDVTDKNRNEAPSIGGWGHHQGKMKGRVIIGWEGDNHPVFTPNAHAVYWNSLTTIVSLPIPSVLPNGKPVLSSEAVCISDNGQTIGGNLYYQFFENKSSFSYPCIWKLQSGIYVPHILKDIAGGDENARITHISGDGLVVVGWGAPVNGDVTCYGYPRSACKWKYSQALQWNIEPTILHALSNRFIHSIASGTNQDGSVVVGSCYMIMGCTSDFEHDSRAILWSNQNSPVDLTERLANYISPGMKIWQAVRVSADGKTVIGINYNSDFSTSEGWTAWL